MSGIYPTVMGDRGRLVVPAELRASAGLGEGTPVVLLDTPGGVVLLSRAQLKARVRADLGGTGLVDALVRERRAAAACDEAG